MKIKDLIKRTKINVFPFPGGKSFFFFLSKLSKKNLRFFFFYWCSSCFYKWFESSGKIENYSYPYSTFSSVTIFSSQRFGKEEKMLNFCNYCYFNSVYFIFFKWKTRKKTHFVRFKKRKKKEKRINVNVIQ